MQSFRMPPHSIAAAAGRWAGLILAFCATGLAMADASHWAYRPPRPARPPEILDQEWPSTGSDRFLLHRWEDAGLRPLPDATPDVLCRRLHFDLTGLPPTPEELASFSDAAQHNRDAALRQRVDQLLASPRFGERWARHWFDVVRFAESVTLRGFVFPQAWRYRDYVIDAFNADLPYDGFVREQIAGDLLEGDTLGERQRRMVAATFLALGNTNLEEQDKRQLDLDVVDEQLDVIGKAFLGQTLGCARCHDHKFDPIPTRDYHALAGILASTRLLEHANVSTWTERPLPLDATDDGIHREREARSARVSARMDELKAALKTAAATPAAASIAPRDLPGITRNEGISGKVITDVVPFLPATPGGPQGSGGVARIPGTGPATPQTAELELELKQLMAEWRHLRSGPARPRVMAPVEGTPTNLPVFLRGNVHHPGPIVPRGVLAAAFQSPVDAIPENASGRRQLAEWMTHPDHPLTARVWVNRVWHWIHGRGIVRTTDNFGTTGEAPSHPELLDTLTVRFIANGWSTKWLIREIVGSRAYRQAAHPSADVAASLDPDRHLLHGAARRRLDAESLRDAMLAVSGDLDLTAPSGPAYDAGRTADYGFVATELRRSVYLPVFRNALPEMLSVFDVADPGRVVGVRDHSTVAPQALFLLNHPFVRERARNTALRLASSSDDPESRLQSLYRTALSRFPTDTERALAHRHLAAVEDPGEAWTDLVQAVFASPDFRYLE